jgi:GT2 family glycosyltransferase
MAPAHLKPLIAEPALAQWPLPDTNPAPPLPRVSVVVPVFGHLETLRLCLPRLQRLSLCTFDLLLLDVGSLDGTAEYLAGFADSSLGDVRVRRSEADLSLPEACAEAVSQARGELIVLVSGDTLVTEGWLSHLTALAGHSPDIGMVGTMSNLAPPPQWVGPLPYRLAARKSEGGAALDLAPLDAFAGEWRERHRGQSFAAERLGGSCLLLKAEVLGRLHLERCQTPFGALDGDRLSREVRAAGYRLACCQDVFMHHLGTRPFAVLRETGEA